MYKILVIDDEAGIRNVLRDVLEDEDYIVHLAEDGIKGLLFLDEETVDLVILDVWLPNMGGIDVLKKIKSDHPGTAVIIISGHANINLAVKAVKLGAFDFLEKPLSLEKIITVVQNALKYEALKQENKTLKHSILMEDELVGGSAPMQKIRSLIDQSAGSDSRILILGENGTGKELLAREIHRKSRRAEGPFVEVNCAAIPETLIESELFGHEKGAFTNAISQRKGKFELAHQGTLFLDEIADMSLSTQAKVLRAIQELKFERIGGEESIEVDVRILAATNKDIRKEIEAKRFREDLYFRLSVIPLLVPPLRERQADIEDLLQYFMQKFKRPAAKSCKVFTAEALEALKNYPWPGNVRELKNFTERINIMVEGENISKEMIGQYLGDFQVTNCDDSLEGYSELKLSEARQEFEKKLILKKLEENGFNISRAAQQLGIYPSNLHSKIKKYNLELKK